MMTNVIAFLAIGVVIYFILKIITKTTSYGPLGTFGGYSETQLGPDMYEVKFQGNGNVSVDRSIDLCMLRSGELTLKNGYKYFFILEKRNEGRSLINGNQSSIQSHPSTVNNIKMVKEKPENDLGFYDAAFIVDTYKKKYSIK